APPTSNNIISPVEPVSVIWVSINLILWVAAKEAINNGLSLRLHWKSFTFIVRLELTSIKPLFTTNLSHSKYTSEVVEVADSISAPPGEVIIWPLPNTNTLVFALVADTKLKPALLVLIAPGKYQ